MKIINLMTAILLLVVLVISSVSAVQSAEVQPINDGLDVNATPSAYIAITDVKINSDTAYDGDDLYVERGDVLKVRVTLEAGDQDVTDAYLGAFMSGYRYAYYERDMVTDYTKTFSLPAHEKRSFDLTVTVPVDMEKKDAKLRLVLFDENSASVITYNYQVSIYGTADDSAVQIQDFFVSPSTTIEAGRALSFKVKVKNYGNNDLDDVKVKVAIPALNIQTYETIDTLDKDESQSFEALLLRIPPEAKPGDYEVVATVEFDRFQSVEESTQITIINAEVAQTAGSDSVITMPEAVDVVKGTQGSVYPVLIENKGATSKTYVLTVSGVSDWGTVSFEPSSVVVISAGQSQTVYLRVSANDNAVAGDKVFKVVVKADEVSKETTVVAKVKDDSAQGTPLKAVLEWALIILIVVLIILGIVLLVNKMRNNKDEEDDEQTYY